MSEQSISEQIIDAFIEDIGNKEVINKDQLERLKTTLNSDRPQKTDILRAIMEDLQK